MKTKRSFAWLATMAMAIGTLSCGSGVSTAHAATPTVLASVTPPPKAPDGTNKLEKDFRDATALLYAQTDDGGYRMMCTATAFEKKGGLYHFVTAAHCVSEDDTEHEKIEVAKTNWFITFDMQSNNSMIEAKVIGVGYQHRGDDFAVLEVKLPTDVPTMPLAAFDPSLGEEVSNFASPLGLGKQLFRGHVSMEHLNRPLVQDSINWRGATMLQISGGPGSSGSAIVSQEQKGIVAFLVGMINQRGSTNIVAIPVGRFKTFWAQVQDHKYKWYKPEDGSLSASKESASSTLNRLWNRIHTTGIVYQYKNEE